MKRWLALRLQGLVTRLTRPIATSLSDRIDGARGEARDSAALLLGAVHDLAARQAESERVLGALAAHLDTQVSDLAERIGTARHDIAEASTRDLAAVVRMLAAVDAGLTDLRAALHPGATGRDTGRPEAAVPVWRPGARHVIVLGPAPMGESSIVENLLTTLRTGLDRSEEPHGGTPELWIERPRASDGPGVDGALPSDSYIRIMRGGTRSIEVLRPADVGALRDALERNNRRDVAVVFRWCDGAVSDTDDAVIRRALAGADHWVFPSQDLADAIVARSAPSAADRAGKHLHFHPLPDPTTAEAEELARAYRASVAAILQPGIAEAGVPR